MLARMKQYKPTPTWPSLKALMDTLPPVTEESWREVLNDPDPLMRKAARESLGMAPETTSLPVVLPIETRKPKGD